MHAFRSHCINYDARYAQYNTCTGLCTLLSAQTPQIDLEFNAFDVNRNSICGIAMYECFIITKLTLFLQVFLQNTKEFAVKRSN